MITIKIKDQYISIFGMGNVWMGNVTKVVCRCFQWIDEGYFLEVDVQYPETLHDLHNDLSFSLEGIEKVGKLAVKLDDKKEYVIHKRSLKQASNYELGFKKLTEL